MARMIVGTRVDMNEQTQRGEAKRAGPDVPRPPRGAGRRQETGF